METDDPSKSFERWRTGWRDLYVHHEFRESAVIFCLFTLFLSCFLVFFLFFLYFCFFFLFLLFIATWKCADSVNVSIWTGDRDKVSWSTKNFPVLATCSFVLWRGAFITSISRSCNQRTCFCYVLCTTAIDYLVNEHLPQYVPFSI